MKLANETRATHETLKKSMLSLNIYFDKLEYTVIDETVKTTLTDLIADIGGNLKPFQFVKNVDY